MKKNRYPGIFPDSVGIVGKSFIPLCDNASTKSPRLPAGGTRVPVPADPARAAAPPGPVHTTRAAGMRNKLYYQVSQNLRKPQPGGGRLVPGGGRAQESQARAKPSILPLQQEALAALRPGRAVSCPMGDAWGHRGGCCTSQHTAALLGLLKHAKMDFAHPSQDCCSPC